MKSAVAFCLAAVTAFALMPVAAYAQGQLLRIQELQGKAELQRGGRSQAAAEGGVLQADDVLVLGSGARAALKLGRHGLLELGPGSSVQIERLPFATYATDLRTVLRLQKGYLRVIWKQPPLDIHWPLFVYVDTDSANLITGEYFFEKTSLGKAGEGRALCSAEGDLTLTGAGHADSTKVEADSCWIVAPGVAGLRKAVDMDDWIAVRQDRTLGRMAQAPRTAVAAASAPAPATASAPPTVAAATPQPAKPAERPVEKPQVTQTPTAVPGLGPGADTLAAAQPTLPAYVPKPKPAAERPTPATSALAPTSVPAYVPSSAPTPSAQTVTPTPPSRPAYQPSSVAATPGGVPATNPAPAPLPAYKPATPAPAAVVEAPKPSPRPAAASSGSGRWAVNIASVPDRPSAQKELARLGKSGFAGAIAEAEVKGKTWYRIQIQGLQSRDEANDIAEQLQSAGYASPWVIKP
ncbi:SPOR domain-containing protein [Hydrocarboniphaga effusa]|uniref:SPOR domain-containing protein n=1 Tax=Hydrocarboniphaga effusa TaxID=243629 RepID=UPI00398C06F5